MTEQMFLENSTWQRQTFGEATALSKLHHLHEEVLEAMQAIYNEDPQETRKEFADCFILLFGAASAAGFSYQEILDAINEKMEINKSRQWGKPDELGVVRHIKTEQHD